VKWNWQFQKYSIVNAADGFTRIEAVTLFIKAITGPVVMLCRQTYDVE